MPKGWEPSKCAVSAQKALQGSETETKELLRGTEEFSIIPDEGSFICLPDKSMTFYLKQTGQNGVCGQTSWINRSGKTEMVGEVESRNTSPQRPPPVRSSTRPTRMSTLGKGSLKNYIHTVSFYLIGPCVNFDDFSSVTKMAFCTFYQIWYVNLHLNTFSLRFI